MVRDFSRFALVLILALAASPAAAQNHTLTVRNGDQAIRLSMTDLAALPASRLTPDDPDKREYEGVALVDLLSRAGVTFGQTLRGPRLATYLVATGADGYRVVIALPEIDPDFTRHPGALVALRQNGKSLSPRDGPLQLVLPADKRHARWVRTLTSLEIIAAPAPR
jgi:hypothetical protein